MSNDYSFMQQEYFLCLLLRRLKGHLTAEEGSELLQFIKGNPEMGIYLQMITNLWYQSSDEGKQKIIIALNKIKPVIFDNECNEFLLQE